jgi:hypothetical protein
VHKLKFVSVGHEHVTKMPSARPPRPKCDCIMSMCQVSNNLHISWNYFFIELHTSLLKVTDNYCHVFKDHEPSVCNLSSLQLMPEMQWWKYAVYDGKYFINIFISQTSN